MKWVGVLGLLVLLGCEHRHDTTPESYSVCLDDGAVAMEDALVAAIAVWQGRITDAPIVPIPAGYVDLQHVLTHELGHVLDLPHILEPPGAIMAPHVALGEENRNLSPADVLLLEQLADVSDLYYAGVTHACDVLVGWSTETGGALATYEHDILRVNPSFPWWMQAS